MNDPEFAERVIDEFVRPIYLTAQVNDPDPVLANFIAERGRAATTEEVLWMLGSHWRPRRVGAWFSLVHPESEVTPALLESLRTSLGYLTAPILGFVAVRRVGADALPALHEYQAEAQRQNYGGVATITALIELAGGRSSLAPTGENDFRFLDHMAKWCELIQGNATN